MSKVNVSLICITIFLIIGLIFGTTIYKVMKTHNDNLLKVSEKFIIEHAKDCYNEKRCTNETVTLKELYDLKYLARQANPVTKEYYKEESYVKKEGNTYTFVMVS